MRTTIDLPDELLRELKALAAHRGTSLKTVIRIAVEEEIRKTGLRAGCRLKFPLLSSHEPGALNPRNADLEKIFPSDVKVRLALASRHLAGSVAIG